MKYTYTAIFTPEPSQESEGKTLFGVSFPDLPCHTCGDDLSHAIYMAQDALCLMLYHMEQDGEAIPKATPPNEIKVVGEEFSSIISVDTDDYKRFYDKKAVKKTLTIPSWLNQKAETANINFSKTLQKALKEELQLTAVD